MRRKWIRGAVAAAAFSLLLSAPAAYAAESEKESAATSEAGLEDNATESVVSPEAGQTESVNNANAEANGAAVVNLEDAKTDQPDSEELTGASGQLIYPAAEAGALNPGRSGRASTSGACVSGVVGSGSNDVQGSGANTADGQVISEPRYAPQQSAGTYSLDSQIFSGFGPTNYSFAQYENEQNRGIYTLSSGKLWFTSVDDGTSTQMANFAADSYTVVCSCRQGKMLYVLTRKSVRTTTDSGTVWVDEHTVKKYDLDLQEAAGTVTLSIEGERPTALGVDGTGRIYAGAPSKIYLFSATGTLLDSCEFGKAVYRFSGFDASNGNFYFEGFYNHVYWGYDHSTSGLYSGRVVNGQLSIQQSPIEALFQKQWYDHNTAAELVGGKYLLWSAHYMNNRVGIGDSAGYDPTEESPSFNMLFGVSRSELESDRSGQDKYSWGVRTVYNPARDSFIVYIADGFMAEFRLAEGTDGNQFIDEIASFQAKEHVFSLFMIGDEVVAIEQDNSGNYTLERVSWKPSSYVQIKSDKDSVEAGGTLQLTADYDAAYEEIVEWSSSNPSVATITQSGEVFSVKPGTVNITATLKSGLSATRKITVTKRTSDAPAFATRGSGTASKNYLDENYSAWASVSKSFIYQDGSFLWRVEAQSGKVLAEKYSSDGKSLKGKKELSMELPLFGGFYSGTEANFLVFGQQNPDQSDEQEVLRIVKYDKNWNRLGAAAVKGANTFVPFDAGSLRMTEVEGQLYLHTCHEMYADSSGTHHQANMSYILDIANMEIIDSYYETMNFTTGYVSHSFNQFIAARNGRIFRVDHAEGSFMYMNGKQLSGTGIVLNRIYHGQQLDSVSYCMPLSLSSSGNYTGISIGGFALSSENCLIAYNRDISSARGNRNVFLSVTDHLFNRSKQIAVSSYTSTGGQSAATPHLVQINDYIFLVLWNEIDKDGKPLEMHYRMVDGAGNLLGTEGRLPAVLSDCSPIVTSDGIVKWYTATGNTPVFYQLDPFNIPALQTKTGWCELTKGIWYFNQSGGTRATGWMKNSGKWYWFDPTGIMLTGWGQIDGKWYYFDASGVMLTGWQKIGAKWYYMNPAGDMQTKWKKIDNVWYYFGTSGAAVTGWQKIDGKWYFFTSSGAMKTGWLNQSGKWYFLDASGAMVTGTRVIFGKSYTFDKNGVCQNP